MEICKFECGGVLIAVLTSYNSYSSWWSCAGICEDLCETVDLSFGKRLHICCVYIPPYTNFNVFLYIQTIKVL